jgi:hypothetical protein
LLALVLLLLPQACGGPDSTTGDERRVAISETPLPPYETIPLDSTGRLEGIVAWEGALPSSTTLAIADSLTRTCRTSRLQLTPVRVVRGGVNGAVAWLGDARRGKALPAARRFELATDRCRLTPPVQAAIAGGMLNVLSLDRLEHRLQFTRVGTEGTVGRVEQFDAGQVVPLETVLGLPGPVTVQSDRFPWMEAWIHVFDHPYFATSAGAGAFAMDSIPPGRYELIVWHPATGQRDTTILVSGGDTVRVRVSVSLAGAEP